MRILLLTTYFEPDVASTGVIFGKLAHEFADHGHTVTVLTSCPHYDPRRRWPEFSRGLFFIERAGPVRIYRVRVHASPDRSSVLHRLLSYASFHFLAFVAGLTLPKQDVILAASPPLSNGVVAWLLARLRRITFIYNVQDIWPDVIVRSGIVKNRLIIDCLKLMEAHVYKTAACMSVISDGFRANLLGKGVPEDKISVIPNFIDTDFVIPRPKNNDFALRHGVADKFVVLFAGNMGLSQDLATVAESARLLAKYSDIQFLLVGDGAGRQAAERRVGDLGCANLQFLPYQSREQVPDMYGSSDVCLIPLRAGFAAESVPCKLFSIMAAERAAIASVDRNSDTWKLMDRLKCGLCVEPGRPAQLAEAILTLYRDAVAKAALGKAGRRSLELEFLPKAIAGRYLGLLQRLTCSPALHQG